MKLTDEEGSTVASYAYGTYGELLSGNAGLTRFLYNGSCGVSTDANGLYYMRQRYYNPETKRFLNQDILTGSIGNSQSLNRYSYVQGNPVSSTDPFGLSPLNMMEGTDLIHGILGLLGCIPGPVGAVANLVDAGVYCFVDHDYGMAALSLASSVAMGAGSIAVGAGSVVEWAGSGAAKASLGAAKAAKVARSAEYVRTTAAFVTNAAIFAGGGISLWQNSDKLYQKYKAGELKLDWETAAEAGAAVFSAAACVVSGAGMVKEAKNLGKMMKEDNVVGRLKESVGRFGSSAKGLGSQMKTKASNLGSQIKGQSFRGESGSKTGTVWDNIKATQDKYPYTNIPKSFEVEVNGQKMWVHGNATEHMYSDVFKKIIAGEGTAHTNPDLYTQILMSDFYGSLEQATASGIEYEKLISAGNWEFIFSLPRQEGLLPVIKHAQFNGW